MAVLAEPHGIAGYLVFQSGMQGLAEGVNVEMVPHAQAADNRPSGHELNLALISPVIADDSDDVLRPHHVVAHTVLINGQIFDVRGQGTMQVFGGNASCRSVRFRSLGLALRAQYGRREDRDCNQQAKEKITDEIHNQRPSFRICFCDMAHRMRASSKRKNLPAHWNTCLSEE